MRKHILLLMLSINMGASLILTPVTAAEEAATTEQQAEETDATEETAYGLPADEMPAEATADKDTFGESSPAEDKQAIEEIQEANPSEKDMAGSEEGSSAADNSVPAGQSEGQTPAAATKPSIESTELNTAPAAADEEIKETSVKALQKSWYGPGFYDIFDKKGVFQGCRYVPTKST